jgi:hypothetical protein
MVSVAAETALTSVRAWLLEIALGRLYGIEHALGQYESSSYTEK